MFSKQGYLRLLFVVIVLAFGTITQIINGASRLPFVDVLTRCAGSAFTIAVFAAVFSYILKWILKLFRVPLSSEAFLLLLSGLAVLVGSFSLAGLWSSRHRAATDAPHEALTERQAFVFMSEGCEYSITFPRRPELSDSKAHLFEYETDGKLAMLQIPGDKGFLRAECYPVSPELTSQVDKQHAYKGMQMIAEAAGVKDFHLSYSESLAGKLCEMRGTKTLADPKGNQIRLMMNWRTYYGAHSVFAVMIVGSVDSFPTPEQIAFRDSIKRIGQETQ